jgi:hypothetical protein
MKRRSIFTAASIILLLFCGKQALAQAQTDVETHRFEVGAHFSSLSVDEGYQTRGEPGVGGRITYNVTERLALEAEGNFFPTHNSFGTFRTGGRAIQGLFGVKFGKRYKRFGIFAKARPGFISFAEGLYEFIPTTPTVDPFAPFTVRTERLTHLAADIGGVLEFYPTRRVFTRIDIGDTIIRYGETRVNNLSIGANNQFIVTPITVPGDTTHNFQFTAGVGFRF